MRLDRWSQNGVLERGYVAEGLTGDEVYALDSTAVKVHPDVHEAGKNGAQAIGKTRGGWNTKIHAPAKGERRVEAFSLSAGNVADVRAGRLLPETVGSLERTVPLLMDRGYEDDRTRQTAWRLRFNPTLYSQSTETSHEPSANSANAVFTIGLVR
jgi:hypothetical protein